jgi:uncharacterized protein YceK
MSARSLLSFCACVALLAGCTSVPQLKVPNAGEAEHQVNTPEKASEIQRRYSR